MFRRISKILALASLLTGGCSQKVKPVNQDIDEEVEEEFSNDGQEDASDYDDAYSVWCDKANAISLVQEKMKTYYDRLCVDGKPTRLFATSLPSVAYNGSGEPEPKRIAATTSDDTYVTVTLGTAIKIPISMKTHFDSVAPKGGDEQAQEAIGADQNADVDVEIRKTYTEDGTYHVRGWDVYTKSVKNESGIDIVTETVARNDQFQLEEGSAYLYTSYVTESIQGIKETDLFTAGVQVDDQAYLLTLAYLVADKKGAPQSLAESIVLDTARELMKSMYEAAAEAQ